MWPCLGEVCLGGVDIPRRRASVEITFPVKRQGREGGPVNAALVAYRVLTLHSVLSTLALSGQFTGSTWGSFRRRPHSRGK